MAGHKLPYRPIGISNLHLLEKIRLTYFNEIHTSLKVNTVDMSVADFYYVQVSAEIFDDEMLFLLGPDILIDLRAILKILNNQRSGLLDHRSVPLVRRVGQKYAQCSFSSTTQLYVATLPPPTF